MSTTSKKAPEKHEAWQDDVKTTDELYRQYDEERRREKIEGDRKRKRMVEELASRKKEMEEELRRKNRRDEILAKKRKEKEEQELINLEKEAELEKEVKINNDKWYNKIIKVIMGWD